MAAKQHARINSPPVSLSQICKHLSSPHKCHMCSQSHPPALDHHNNIWPGVQTLLITRFSQRRGSSSRLRQTTFSAPHPRTPSAHHQVSHPYQTTGNIIVLYMLVFIPFNNKPSAASDSGTLCSNATRSAWPRLYQTLTLTQCGSISLELDFSNVSKSGFCKVSRG